MPYYKSSSARRQYFVTFGQGRPVIFLHGITNSGRAWGAQLAPFVEAGFQVILPDHAGHGASDPIRGPIAVADLANDALTLLDHLGIESADVVGLSLGGMVAMQLALQAPARVQRLVVANSFPAFKGEAIRDMVHAWTATFREQDGPVKRLEQTWPINVSPAFRQSAEGLRMYQVLHGIAATTDGASLAHVAEGILGFDIEARLEQLEPETLFMAGTLDTISPPAISQHMAEALARAKYVELPQAAHLSNVDSADAFNEAVLTFLSQPRQPLSATNADGRH